MLYQLRKKNLEIVFSVKPNVKPRKPKKISGFLGLTYLKLIFV